jgi:hypothetical protein
MQESPEVAIARIQAQSALDIAKIQARQDRDWNETRLEVAEVEAGAEVAAAEATAEVVAAVLDSDDQAPEPAPNPIVVDAPEISDEEIVEDAPPPADEAPAPSAPSKPRGLGMW